MKWTVYTVTTSVEAEDYVCAALLELGFEGVEIVDNVPLTEAEAKAQFIDIPLVCDESDTTSQIRCYEELTGDSADESDIEKSVASIREAVSEYADIVDLGDFRVDVSVTEDLDWINNWKQYFHSFRIGEDILVKPTWETDAEIRDGDMVIEIDPGTAFGTGSHETTWLCIEGLRDVVTKDTAVLDIGCGSGILSIVAMKLGAAYAVGVDIDPIAVDVSKENATQNGLSLFEAEVPEIKPGTVSFFAGDVLSDEAFCEALTLEKYPVVVANILADVIMPLAPVVKRFLTKDGVFLCSGILNTREEEVRASLAKDGYEVIGVRRKNDWVSLLARAL